MSIENHSSDHHEPLPNPQRDGSSAAGGAEFAHDGRDVEFDGVAGILQTRGDFLIPRPAATA